MADAIQQTPRPTNESKTESAAMLCAATAVVAYISTIAAELDIGLFDIGTAGIVIPFVSGSIIDVAVAAWNDLWDESEEVGWLEAEREVIER
ncbi:uncharacterized protein METZ01_LOCUS301912, partial [marine metagenome]